jgi:alpha-galactosidase
MKTITLITNGPENFLSRFWQDVFAFPCFRKDIQIKLMNPDTIPIIQSGSDYLELHNKKFTNVMLSQVDTMTEAVTNADYIIGNFAIGGWDAYHHDMEIPLKYGVSQCVGDTLGPAGIFRFLRSTSVLKELAQNIPNSHYSSKISEKNPIFLNLSNPMAMTLMYIDTLVPGSAIGLCPGVQNTANLLRMYLAAMPEEMRYTAAGINHMTWFLNVDYNQGGKKGDDWVDGYPIIHENVEDDPDMVAEEKLRWDMMQVTGLYMAEGSPQLSEYLPYYRKRPDILEKYKGAESGPKSLEHATDWKEYTRQQEKNNRSNQNQEQKSSPSLPFCEKPSDFLPVHVLNAFEMGGSYQFSGNIINKNSSYISNLPPNACVEVPCQIIDKKWVAQQDLRLPSVCAALCLSNIMVQQLAVEAALEEDPNKIIHALLLDPNTASICCPTEIKSMGEELIQANKKWISWL